MPTIGIQVRVRADTPALAEADATIIVQPYREVGSDANGTGAVVLFGKREVITVKDGVADHVLELAPTDGTFCYRWEILFAGGSAALVRFTLVPDAEQVDFWELEDVDPTSFQPTGGVLEAWLLAAAAALQSQQSAAASAGAAHDDRVLAETARLAAEQAAQAGGFVLSPTADVSGVLNLSALNRNTIAHRRLVGNVTGITTPDQPYAGQIVTLVLTQDATGGRTMAFPAAIFTHEGVDPVLSTTAAAVDVIHLWFDGVRWWGFVAAQRGA